MIVELPDHMVDALGETLFTGLIKLEADGRLMLLVPTSPVATLDDPDWLMARVDCPEARKFGVELWFHGRESGAA